MAQVISDDQIVDLLNEVVDDDTERKHWLTVLSAMNADQKAEFRAMLERQATEQEALTNTQAMELAQMTKRFDSEWQSLAQEAERGGGAEAPTSAPATTEPTESEAPSLTPPPASEAPSSQAPEITEDMMNQTNDQNAPPSLTLPS